MNLCKFFNHLFMRVAYKIQLLGRDGCDPVPVQDDVVSGFFQ